MFRQLLMILVTLSLAACQGVRPTDLIRADGRLSPCPQRPNCVSSVVDEADPQYIPPFNSHGNLADDIKKLERLIGSQPRSRIVERQDRLLWVEFESLVFRYVDDLIFRLVPEDGVIEVRSSSRLGHSDLGVNRRRLEKLRIFYEKM